MKLFPHSLIAALICSLALATAVAQTAPQRNAEQLKLAQELANKGQRAEAMAELNKIAASTDFDPIGFYNLGNAFARLGESDAAINAYRRAIEQRKGAYSRAYNNLGVVLLREGRWDEAYEAFIAALKLENFRYAEASYNLGRLYAARGQNDLAPREWRRALAIDPQHAAAAQALARGENDERIVVARAPVTRSTAEPAKPVSTLPPAPIRRILIASCLATTLPSVTCPSPPRAT